MPKPTSTVLDRNEIMETIEDKLLAMPGISITDDSELVINDIRGRKVIKVTLEIELQADEDE